jgi:23S rRNA (uracil1939-C5)-methyltransferase
LQFDLDIIKVVPPGDGCGYYDGKAVFVPATSPGDRVRVFSLRENRNTISAALQEVLTPSPDRIDPPCPHYSKCGGCSLMHLDYKQQLELKHRMLTEVLVNQGIQWDPQIVPSSETNRFRHKTRVRCVDGQLGFSERQSNRIVEIPECRILTEGILSTLKRLGQLGRSNAEYQLLQSCKTGEVGVSILEGQQLVPLPGFEQSIEEDYGFGPLVLHSHGFAQSNPFITTSIIKDLQHHAVDSRSICELFCGCGTFSLALAATTPQLIGYDISPLSIQTAQETLQRQNLGHVEFAAINLNKLKELPASDLIVADPPRKGLGKHLCRLINGSKARKLLYVSCNPDSLARDIRELTGQGGFELVEMKGYDMYCHATHLEAMAVLVRQV